MPQNPVQSSAAHNERKDRVRSLHQRREMLSARDEANAVETEEDHLHILYVKKKREMFESLELDVEDEDDQETRPAPTQQKDDNRKNSIKISIVQLEDDKGANYFYDDPELGGTGATAWERDELDALDTDNEMIQLFEKEVSGDQYTLNPLKRRSV